MRIKVEKLGTNILTFKEMLVIVMQHTMDYL